MACCAGWARKWCETGWRKCHGELAGSVIAGGNIEGDDPGFLDFSSGDYRPGAKSALRDRATATKAQAIDILFEPPTLKGPGIKRTLVGPLDVGCFEGK